MIKSQMGRRKFLKLMSGAALAGCKIVYEEGVPVARATDGKIDQGVTEYYKNTTRVQEYDKEIADVINETWVKDFGRSIDDKITIRFLDDASAVCGHFGACYDAGHDVEWRELKDTHWKRIWMQRGLPPIITTNVIAHELGHQYDRSERIPELLSFRHGVKSNIHFPEFSKNTDYKLLDRAYYTIAEAHTAIWTTYEPPLGKTPHNMGKLAALFALNKNNGSFDAAHQALFTNGHAYTSLADSFIDHAAGQPDVTVLHTLPDKTQYKSSGVYFFLAFADLINVVTHQLIEKHVKENNFLSAETKTSLEYELQKASFGHFGSVYNTEIQNPFIFYPSDYDYSIPKGTWMPEPESTHPGHPHN